MEDHRNFLNGDTLKVIELIREEVRPVSDNVAALNTTINENVVPVVNENSGHISQNRSDIEDIKAAPAKKMQFIFWVVIIVLQALTLYKDVIVQVMNG